MNFKYTLASVFLVFLVGGFFAIFISPTTRNPAYLFVLFLVILPWIGLFFRLSGLFRIFGTVKYRTGLSEKQTLLLIFSLMLVGGLLGFVVVGKGSVYVTDYSLAINLTSDHASVAETLVYSVSPGARGHEFYRSYYKNGPLAGMYNASADCPPWFDFIVYDKADRKELACRSDEYVKPGKYSVTFFYNIPKPYACYETKCLFDWNFLTDFGLYIEKANVTVSGAEKVWTYPPLKLKRDLPPGTLLEVKAIVPRTQVSEYWVDTGKPDSEIYSNEWTTNLAGLLYEYDIVVYLLVFGLTAIAIYIVYLLLGKDPVVPNIPDVLHYPPTDRKPYQVTELVFEDPTKIEHEGITATLLDLARRGWVKISGNKIDFMEGSDQLDDYEKKVYEFYKWLTDDGKLDMKSVNGKISRSADTSWLKEIKKRIDDLTKPTLRDAYSNLGHFAALFIAIAPSLISIPLANLLPASLQRAIMFMSIFGFFAILFLDAFTFGRYKKEIYKEVLLWRAFGRLLGDYGMIKKYAPEDILMWGKWLVYATALGKADNVLRAMREMNIRLPNIDYDTRRSYYIYPWVIYSASQSRYASLTSSSSSGSWSGGGGFGGGFGGGGGGFR